MSSKHKNILDPRIVYADEETAKLHFSINNEIINMVGTRTFCVSCENGFMFHFCHPSVCSSGYGGVIAMNNFMTGAPIITTGLAYAGVVSALDEIGSVVSQEIQNYIVSRLSASAPNVRSLFSTNRMIGCECFSLSNSVVESLKCGSIRLPIYSQSLLNIKRGDVLVYRTYCGRLIDGSNSINNTMTEALDRGILHSFVFLSSVNGSGYGNLKNIVIANRSRLNNASE